MVINEDKITIVDSYTKKPKYLLVGNQIIDYTEENDTHIHKFDSRHITLKQFRRCVSSL